MEGDNGPILALLFLFSGIFMPIVLLCNFWVLHKRSERTIFHRAAAWTALGCAVMFGGITIALYVLYRG